MPNGHRNALGWFASQLRARFYLGKIGSGDRLPSVRALAHNLGVSPTTTLELYRALESQGIVEGRQRSGMFLRTVGVEPDRSTAAAALFRLVATTASKLRTTGACPGDFATMLLRYTGEAPRDDFRVGFLGSQESLELIQRQLANRLRFALPMVQVSPWASRRDMRAQLAAAHNVRCLLGSFLAADAGVELAHDFDLPFVILRLSAETVEILQPPPGERRYIVVRDRDTAEGLRRLTCAVCHAEHRLPACPAAPNEDAHLPCEGVGHDRRPFVQVAALNEESRLAEFERDADTVYATITSIVAVKARFGSRRIATFPVTVSEHTVNDVLFHYLFAQRPATVVAMAGRRA
jgi:DNA-binding transcriptional regulator YhcF (GntR family)